MRISRDKYFMEITKLVAKRSPCLSRQVGAVVVGDNRIISTGYNGPPAKYPHCTKCNRSIVGKDLDLCPALHAEANAILEAKNNSRIPIVVYVTTEPCFECCKLIAMAGIKKIIYLEDYSVSDLCNDFLHKNGIVKEKYEQD